MSELTQCCFCALQDMRKPISKEPKWNREFMSKYKKPGDRIYLRKAKGEHGGFDVFRVHKGDRLDKSVDEKGNHGLQWVAWFGGMSEGCVC